MIIVEKVGEMEGWEEVVTNRLWGGYAGIQSKKEQCECFDEWI